MKKITHVLDYFKLYFEELPRKRPFAKQNTHHNEKRGYYRGSDLRRQAQEKKQHRKDRKR